MGTKGIRVLVGTAHAPRGGESIRTFTHRLIRAIFVKRRNLLQEITRPYSPHGIQIIRRRLVFARLEKLFADLLFEADGDVGQRLRAAGDRRVDSSEAYGVGSRCDGLIARYAGLRDGVRGDGVRNSSREGGLTRDGRGLHRLKHTSPGRGAEGTGSSV